MTDDERDVIALALGLEYLDRTWGGNSRRNIALEGCDDLCETGFMIRGTVWVAVQNKYRVYYQVTDAGIHAAGFDDLVRLEDRIGRP